MRRMRGDDREPDSMFSYVSTEQRIPKDHPLRAIRALVDDALHDMSREFDLLYAAIGRPSVPPERLLRAQCSKSSTRFAASERVGFTNLITPPGRTREPHHRDDRDAGHEPRPTPSPAPPADVSGAAA